MTARDNAIFYLINDPICIALMTRDGVHAHDILNLMRSIKPLAARGQPSCGPHRDDAALRAA